MTVRDDYLDAVQAAGGPCVLIVFPAKPGDAKADLQKCLDIAAKLGVMVGGAMPNGREIVILPTTDIDTLVATFGALWAFYDCDEPSLMRADPGGLTVSQKIQAVKDQYQVDLARDALVAARDDVVMATTDTKP